MSFTIDFEPIGTRLVCEEPIVLLDAATRAGVHLRAICGGKATCGKCLVRVSAGNVSPATDAERLLLSDAEIAAGYRQACRTLVSGNVSVYVPPESLLEEQKLQVEGVESTLEVDPAVCKYRVSVTPASLADPRGDLDRTADALREQHGIVLTRADLPTLAQLSAALRDHSSGGGGGWTITATVRDGELIAAEAGDTTNSAVGLAVDLGTTKIACYLVDLLSGRTLAARGVMNPQIGYGEDVIARIEAAVKSEAARVALREMVSAAINDVAADLCKSVGIAPDQILEMTIVGNTAMHHLALGLPVRQLGVIPFVPVTAQPLDAKCATLGLIAAPGAYVHFPPLIAGFVGSDHIAALVAARVGQVARAACPQRASRPLDTRLTIDLGTNTELALEARGRVVSCSTACGPAFEGAHIKFGMRAAPGAIERVKIADGEVQIATIGGKPAVGICGSGILDAVAELLKVGWMNAQGRLNTASPFVRQSVESAVKEFVLARATPDGGREVMLTQKDLGEIQLAKGAIRAGIDILLEEMNVHAEEIDEVIVAGAFGTYLDPLNAVRIGLFPRVPLSRIHQVGNAAGVGAKQMLVSRHIRAEGVRLSKEVGYRELTLHRQFATRFAEGMQYG
jgi:uncharacterized 2Fe-2S/4Fe-4S cluster protein (DUF4445 family)